MTTISERLGRFAAGLHYEDLPPRVQQRTADCVLHALVVGAGAHVTGFEEAVLAVVGDELDGPSTIAGRPARASARSAAFANGVLFHARVQEDTHGTLHPGVSVIPAALALAESRQCDGATFLAAVAAGYEVGGALSRVLTDRATPPHRATGVFGPVAAAAAAARVLRLDAERTVAAVSFGASLCGGTTESFGAGTHEWHFQSGQAAMAGVTAALMAEHGASASPRAFEGEGGYLDCYAGGGSDADRIGRDLGSTWESLAVTFKPYPVCAFNQAPALAAIELARSVDAGDVAGVEIEMSEREGTYPGVDHAGPIRTPEEAIMSAPLCVVTALLDGDVTFAGLRRADDPRVRALLARTRVVPHPERAQKTASVRVRLGDGRLLTATVDDTDDRLSWDRDQVRANASRLLPETRWDEARLRDVVAAIDELPTSGSVKRLVDAALA